MRSMSRIDQHLSIQYVCRMQKVRYASNRPPPSKFQLVPLDSSFAKEKNQNKNKKTNKTKHVIQSAFRAVRLQIDLTTPPNCAAEIACSKGGAGAGRLVSSRAAGVFVGIDL